VHADKAIRHKALIISFRGDIDRHLLDDGVGLLVNDPFSIHILSDYPISYLDEYLNILDGLFQFLFLVMGSSRYPAMCPYRNTQGQYGYVRPYARDE